MKILVACESSGVVRNAFLAAGHDAWSCDILPADDGHKNHIQCDCLEILNDGWDMMIAHPPCTYLSYAATRVWNVPGREQKRIAAMEFFKKLYYADIKRIAVENPVGYPNTVFRKPDQIISPHLFGEPVSKKTCLWLKGLPLLTPGKYVEPKQVYYRKDGKPIHFVEAAKKNGLEPRWKVRSKTFSSIAKAMAEQWGNEKYLNELPEQMSLFAY